MTSTSATVRAAYQLYDDDDLDEFEEMAIALLQGPIIGYHRVKLFILLSNTAEGPTMMTWLFHRARYEFSVASHLKYKHALSPQAVAELQGDLDLLEAAVAALDSDDEVEEEQEEEEEEGPGEEGGEGGERMDMQSTGGQAPRANIIVPVMQNPGQSVRHGGESDSER